MSPREVRSARAYDPVGSAVASAALSVENSREVKALSGFWRHWIIDDPGSNEPITQTRFPQNGTGLALNRRRNKQHSTLSMPLASPLCQRGEVPLRHKRHDLGSSAQVDPPH